MKKEIREESKRGEKPSSFMASEGQVGDFQNDNKYSPPRDTGLLQLPAQWGIFCAPQDQIVHASYL